MGKIIKPCSFCLDAPIQKQSGQAARTSRRDTCGEKIKAAKTLAAVTEALLPFINGPSLL